LTFSDRIKQIRKLGRFKSWQAVAVFTGISRPMIYAMINGDQTVSSATEDKLSEAEKRLSDANIRANTVEESQSNYRNVLPENRKQAEDPSSLKINTGFRTTPGEPSAEDCISYMAAYTLEARHVPGAIGHTWRELQRRFPLDEIRQDRARAAPPSEVIKTP
jgi:hypothetical protein